MTPVEARSTLDYLVNKYVQDGQKRIELLSIIHDAKLPSVPVRGVLHDLRALRSEPMSEADGNLIKDLIFYFG